MYPICHVNGVKCKILSSWYDGEQSWHLVDCLDCYSYMTSPLQPGGVAQYTLAYPDNMIDDEE